MATGNALPSATWVRRCARRLRALRPRMGHDESVRIAAKAWTDASWLPPEEAAERLAVTLGDGGEAPPSA